MTAAPRLLSLGAGVQSTAVALLAATGGIDPIDGAIFADTGWEPASVYAQLGRLEREVLEPAGIPLHRVSSGSIRADLLGEGRDRFGTPPVYTLAPDGELGMVRRTCTKEYKLEPIKAKVRELLGGKVDPDTGRVGQPTRGRYAVQLIGISLDEVGRARDSDVGYARHEFPLLDLKLTRADCDRINRRHGFAETAKSACIGCPFHGNAAWRQLRNNNPVEWLDAVEVDRRLREAGSAFTDPPAGKAPLRAAAYLHRSCRPLAEAPIERVTRGEATASQLDLLDAIADAELDAELGAGEQGCSPFTCRDDGL